MLSSSESVLADVIREPILQWVRGNLKEMAIVVLIAIILYKLHLFKLAKIALEYIGVKVK